MTTKVTLISKITNKHFPLRISFCLLILEVDANHQSLDNEVTNSSIRFFCTIPSGYLRPSKLDLE